VPSLFYLKTETNPVSESLFLGNIRRWRKSKKNILSSVSAQYFRPNPLRSIRTVSFNCDSKSLLLYSAFLWLVLWKHLGYVFRRCSALWATTNSTRCLMNHLFETVCCALLCYINVKQSHKTPMEAQGGEDVYSSYSRPRR
jgi:hypothetical protein